MATYVMSDIHGNYEAFKDVLEQIDFKDEDTLYILGDIIDRGNDSLKIILEIMNQENIICLIGNHELMALPCLKFLMQEITDEAIDAFTDKQSHDILLWMQNGGDSTIYEFLSLSREQQYEVIDYLSDFLAYEVLKINDETYILVHAGLGNFHVDKLLDDYSINELVWERSDYKAYYDSHTYIISGHTPTQLIFENERPGFIYYHNNHIAIDCGACSLEGRLACICLETKKEYYSQKKRR